MVDTFPGAILGFREGMEAFLIIGIMLDYLKKSGRQNFQKSVQQGMVLGIVGSVLVGFAVWGIVSLLGASTSVVGKVWESAASLAGLLLLSTFIYWMMKHGRTIVSDVKKDVDTHLSSRGLHVLALVVVLREGVEISLFAFSSVNKESYVLGIILGIVVAAIVSYLIYKSLVKVNLGLIFNITLGYLVLQAGYLLGYSVHELLSALKSVGSLAADSVLFGKVYNFQDTLLDHKTGPFGIGLNILVGWYSRPEWIQFTLQYGYTLLMFILWRKVRGNTGVQSR